MSPVQNVAIIGAGGNIGRQIVAALVKQSKHRVTAITRPDSTSILPAGLHDTKKADYSDHDAVVKALDGQEMLIITLGVFAAKDTQQKLVNAAKDAGVKYIMPNEWGMDVSQNEQLGKDVMLGPGQLAVREHIDKAGLTWVGLSCGFCRLIRIPPQRPSADLRLQGMSSACPVLRFDTASTSRRRH